MRLAHPMVMKAAHTRSARPSGRQKLAVDVGLGTVNARLIAGLKCATVPETPMESNGCFSACYPRSTQLFSCA